MLPHFKPHPGAMPWPLYHHLFAKIGSYPDKPHFHSSFSHTCGIFDIEFLHQAKAMVFHCTLTDMEVLGNFMTG